ncbi:MAG TPA: serine/threonine-protein kinase, partial [Vicinamibacterales bacterium]|nr:serine/threonine-protein kinase [Vicinamibacterales bacterium]
MTAAPTAAPGFPDAPATPAPNAGPRPPSSVRFEPGAILAGRYRLVALLGKGGMGEVYRADDLTLDQPVALKFLPAGVANSAARLAQFHGELRVARQVSHKNVCRLYDLGDADGRRFITMEYIDGEDLASLLRRIGRVPQDKAIEFARQLCAGLSAAHERGVLHRDLKPANVMIDGTGNVRLTDFGLA